MSAAIHQPFVRIEMINYGIGRVWIDGKEIHGVCAIRFSGGVTEPTRVDLSLFAKTVEATGPADVEMTP